jgi:hypothetical protein
VGDAQQGFRKSGREFREPPPGPVHASWTGRPWRKVVARTLLVATAVGLFLSLIGPLGDLRRFLVTAAMFMTYSWGGSLLGLASSELVARSPLGNRSIVIRGVAAGLLMAAPMMLVVWTANGLLLKQPLFGQDLAPVAWRTGLICIAASILAAALTARLKPAAPASTPPTIAPATGPAFANRLPLRLRGAELWAVEAEDHYLRLHTSKGQDLILLRMADALAELQAMDGAQVHRSWWVAREGVADARRVDRRAVIVLKDGREVPVSRSFTGRVRGLGWI